MTFKQKNLKPVWIVYNFQCSLWLDQKCIENYESDYNSWTGLRGQEQNQNISMAIIMEVRGAAIFKIISGNIQVICITWSVPDLYLQPLPDRNPRVTRQDLNPTFLLYRIKSTDTFLLLFVPVFPTQLTLKTLLTSGSIYLSYQEVS